MSDTNHWLQALAAYFKPRVLAVFFLGISSGFPLTLLLATLTYWLSKEGVSKGEVGLFASMLTPYFLKFTWAPLVDRLPIPFLSRTLGQRRAWLLTVQIGLVLSILALGAGEPSENLGYMAVCALFVAIFSATQDIVIDAYRIEILNKDEQGLGAAMINFGYRSGNLIAGAGAVALQIYLGWHITYWLMAVLVLSALFAALIVGEPERPESDDVSDQEAMVRRRLAERDQAGPLAVATAWLYATVILPFVTFLRQPMAIPVLVFVVIYKWGDAMAQVMQAPFIVEMGFTDEDYIWANKGVGFAALLLGTAAVGPLVKATGMFRALVITGIFMMVTNLSFAGLALLGAVSWGLAVAVGLENFATGMGLAVFVAYLSSLCNLAFTATHYALLSALAAFARTWMVVPSGYLAEWLGWPGFFVFTTAAAIPGLLLLLWIWRESKPITDQIGVV